MANDDWKSFIKLSLFKLSNSEKRIADLLLIGRVNPQIHSITFVANKANTAPSMVNKMCRKCGIDGWKMLKVLAFSDAFSNQNKSDEFKSNIFDAEYFYLQNLIMQKERYILETIDKITERMRKSQRVLLVANGSTYFIAKILEKKLSKLGLNIHTFDFHVDGLAFHKKDFVIFMSVSGYINLTTFNVQYILNSATTSLITFGNMWPNVDGPQIYLGVTRKFGSIDKPFKTHTDALYLKIINLVVKSWVEHYEREVEIIEGLDKFAS